ncbi:hypothetical protein L208DRAFT_1393644 [Tricholoma matsutake]|nr:hypothetical protein L208DRAFT_1393644 [Tricholoma matsutake 945]
MVVRPRCPPALNGSPPHFLWARLFLRMKSPSQMSTVSSSGPLNNAALLHPYRNAAPISSKNVLLILPYLNLSHDQYWT